MSWFTRVYMIRSLHYPESPFCAQLFHELMLYFFWLHHQSIKTEVTSSKLFTVSVKQKFICLFFYFIQPLFNQVNQRSLFQWRRGQEWLQCTKLWIIFHFTFTQTAFSEHIYQKSMKYFLVHHPRLVARNNMLVINSYRNQAKVSANIGVFSQWCGSDDIWR